MNEPLRTCSDCKEPKPETDFWAPKKIIRNGRTYYSRYAFCKSCGSIRQRAKYTPERERRYRANRYRADPDYKVKQHLSHNYGITLDQYEALLAKQNGICAICGTDKPGNRPSATRFHIDHCHSTGEIRGLLCGNCNAGIGRFADSPIRLEAAARYLQESNTGIYAKRTYRWGRQSGYANH